MIERTLDNEYQAASQVHNKAKNKTDLDLLDKNNWLNDVIINQYMDMLINQFTDIFIFPTFFSQAFLTLNRNYESLARHTNNYNIFNCRLVLFPLLELSHWFLAVMDFKERHFYILDPYIKNQEPGEIYTDHMQQLKKLESEFLKLHYENEELEEWTELKKISEDATHDS